jgi:replicative DNA helicase
MLYSDWGAYEEPARGGNGNGRRPLGQLLVERADLSPEQLAIALERQQSLAARHRYYLLGRVLISLGFVSAHQVNNALALQRAAAQAAEPEAGPAACPTVQFPGIWQAPTGSGPARPISALGVLDGLAQKIAAGDLESMAPVPLGFDPLDEALGGGVRPGELILLGGGQGVGKTTMAFQMARNVAASGDASCLYVCYEHDEENLTQRLIAMESVDPLAGEPRVGVTVRDLTQRILAAHRRGQIALFDLLEADPRTALALQRLRRYGDRVHLLKGSAVRTTLAAIAALVEAHRVRSDQRLVLFVDYLQKVPVLPDPRTEQGRVETVVSGLKDLAMAQGIPVVAVVASDREGLRAKRMRAHHLLGGSLLAYEADVILMLADKYDAVARVHIEFNPQQAQGFHNWVVCSVEKNRSGRDVVEMQFEKLFSFSCLNPNGSYVTEKLVDERLYVE